MSGFIVDASVSAAPSIAQSGYRSCGGWSGNLLLSAPRSRRITAAKRRGLVESAQALRLQVDNSPVAMIVIDELAFAHGLSAYGAAYLELALRRALPLASLEASLIG